ncbi:MAG: hypothetical protein R3F43_17160 [bacterium]
MADATSPGFIRYTRDEGDRWKTGVTIDGRPAALNPGIQANLWIPIGPELAGKKAVIEALIRPFPDKPKVDVFFEGEKVGSPDLKAGAWQIIRVEIPEAKVKEGLAKVRLHFNKSEMQGNQKTATAIRFVRRADASAPAAPEAEADVAGALKSADGDAIVLPDAAGLDYYVSPAADAVCRPRPRAASSRCSPSSTARSPRPSAPAPRWTSAWTPTRARAPA